MDTIKSFISEYGTITVAVLALLQPWFIYVWRKYIRRGFIDFFETGNIEIGFSTFATTIGINGTLRALHKDLYVSKMNLEIVKHKDSSKHELEWGVFRESRIPYHQDDEIKIELPSGFMVSQNSPKKINIQFHDLIQQNYLRPELEKLYKAWIDYLNERYPYSERRADPDRLNKNDQIYNDFLKTDPQSRAYRKLNDEFYWEEGEYTIKLKIITSKPDNEFTSSWKFILKESDVELLRLNVITITDNACNMEYFPWRFAYAKFENEK